MEQGAAQDTLTDRPVFVPSPPFIHTTDTVFSFSPLPALSCLALFLSLPFPLPPLLLFLFRAGQLALESASRVQMRGPDSRGSKNRLGHSRPFSQPPGHKEVEGGMNLKKTQSSSTSDCLTKGSKERTRSMHSKHMAIYFQYDDSFSHFGLKIKVIFLLFFWKTGFCLDIHEKIRSCYIQYQICADSIREASDT